MLDQLWQSPFLPVWLLIAIAGFVGLLLLVALLRDERSIANGTLAVITLVAIGIVVTMALRDGATPEAASPSPTSNTAVSLPALACLDDLAGETVLAACEKLLFSSPDMAAAAVAQTASQLSRLVARGDVATANRNMTPDLQSLRRAIERDRYGLVAYVLAVRDRCTPEQCAAYASLTNHDKVGANMMESIYEATIARYEPLWAAPSTNAAAPMAPVAATGKPNNTDFPTSASIPPVNIMTPEPLVSPSRATAPAVPPAAPVVAPPPPRPAAMVAPPAAPRRPPAAARKQPAAEPVQLAPALSSTAPVEADQ